MKQVTLYVSDEYYDKIAEALPRLSQYMNEMNRGTEVGSQEWRQEVEDCGKFGVLRWLFEQSVVKDI